MAVAEAFGKFKHEVENLPLSEFYDHWAWLAYKREEEKKLEKQAKQQSRTRGRLR